MVHCKTSFLINLMTVNNGHILPYFNSETDTTVVIEHLHAMESYIVHYVQKEFPEGRSLDSITHALGLSNALRLVVRRKLLDLMEKGKMKSHSHGEFFTGIRPTNR